MDFKHLLISSSVGSLSLINCNISYFSDFNFGLFGFLFLMNFLIFNSIGVYLDFLTIFLLLLLSMIISCTRSDSIIIDYFFRWPFSFFFNFFFCFFFFFHLDFVVVMSMISTFLETFLSLIFLFLLVISMIKFLESCYSYSLSI